MKNCNCKKAKEVVYYEYIKHDDCMGFENELHHKFKPNYCPWCGASLEVIDRLDKFKKKHKKPNNKKNINKTWNRVAKKHNKEKDPGYNGSKW